MSQDLPPLMQHVSTAHGTRELAEETAVAITVNGSTYAVMMASPADLEDFAIGFALTETLVTRVAQIESCEIIAYDEGVEARLWLDHPRAEAVAARRRSMTGPVGCGLCGIESLAEAVRPLPKARGAARLDPRHVMQATEALRTHQPLHDQTHAVHAAGFLNGDGQLVTVREDVGRHNALDKLIGALARCGQVAGEGAFVLTSRISTELVQKAAIAGCGALIAVSAPTAHAVRLAQAAGITLIAFARGGTYEVVTHPERLEEEQHGS